MPLAHPRHGRRRPPARSHPHPLAGQEQAQPAGAAGLGWVTLTVPVTILGEPPPFAAGALLGAILDAAVLAGRRALHPLGNHGPPTADAGCRHEESVPGYRIPDRLRALIEARDQVCGYPICRRPAAQCDLDHTVPYHQGGLTCRCNLAPGCRRHHRMKTLTHWRLRQPRPGTLIWTAPSGLAWTASPEPYPT